MAKINHLSHGLADIAGHHVPGNLARDGAPKRVTKIEVAHGMSATPRSGGDALSGHEASAIDSLTGNVTVPGSIKSTPGFGNAGVQSGHPLAKAPGAKNLKPTPVSFGQRSRGPYPAEHMHALGAAMLAEAFAAGDAMDRAAHGRNKDGTK